MIKHLFRMLLVGLLALGGIVYAQNVKTYIHPRAEALMPTVKEEVARFAPEIEYPWYFPGLIEHESCQTLKHYKCWSSVAELKNNREHGVGLFQITAAWDAKGNLRFDNLTSMTLKYRTHLKGLNWETVKDRPDLQIRSGILLWMENYNAFSGMEPGIERMKMSDSAFNGGVSHVKKSRQICQLTAGCNPNIWSLNVEKYLPKSKVPDARYGGRSMYQINTGHVTDVFENRMSKFQQFW